MVTPDFTRLLIQLYVSTNVNDTSMGYVMGEGFYNYGQSTTLSAVPKANHRFVSWSNGNTNNFITITVTNDTTLYAIFEVGKYTISAMSNDSIMGSVSSGGNYNYGETATLTASPNQHYHFVNWSNGRTSSTISIHVYKDSLLTAIFAPDQHTITTSTNAASMGSVIGGGNYDYGSAATLTAIPNEHYHFVRWSNGDTNPTINYTVLNDSTFTAYFEVNRYVVTTNENDTSMGTTSGGGTYQYGLIIGIVANPKHGCRFLNWSNGSTSKYQSFVVTSDTVLTAFFSNKYNLSGLPNYDSCGYVLGSGSYVYGQTITLTAVAHDHYHFVNWSNGKTTLSISVPVFGDSILTANFEIDQHTITAYSNDSLLGSVSGGGTYNYGSIVILTATPKEHYHLVNWSNGFPFPTISVIVEEDTTITANFAIDKHTVSAYANDPTLGTIEGCGQYDYGTTATLNAIASEHYHFVSWSNGETTSTITLTVLGDTSLFAYFEPNTYNVAVTANHSNRGSVSGGGLYTYMDKASITATPNEGFVFSGWSNGETKQAIIITVESDTTITAIFVADNTGVDDINGETELIIAPNPIKVGEATYIYVNGNMNEMYVEILTSDGQCVKSMNCETLPIVIEGSNITGTYMIRITSDNGKIYVRKLIVE